MRDIIGKPYMKLIAPLSNMQLHANSTQGNGDIFAAVNHSFQELQWN